MSRYGPPVFASMGPSGLVHPARCWDCMTLQHPGGDHPWWNTEDVEHARVTHQTPPSGVCGCECANGPVMEQEPPDLDLASLDAPPCPICGSLDACSYDADGRPLIHTFTEDEDA